MKLEKITKKSKMKNTDNTKNVELQENSTYASENMELTRIPVTPECILERTAGNQFTIIKTEDLAMTFYRLYLDIAKTNIQKTRHVSKVHLLNLFMNNVVFTYDMFERATRLGNIKSVYDDMILNMVNYSVRPSGEQVNYIIGGYTTGRYPVVSPNQFIEVVREAHLNRTTVAVRNTHIIEYLRVAGDTSEEEINEMFTHQTVVNVYVMDPTTYFNTMRGISDLFNITSSLEINSSNEIKYMHFKSVLAQLTTDNNFGKYMPIKRVTELANNVYNSYNYVRTYNMFILSSEREIPSGISSKFHVFVDHKYDETFIELLSINSEPEQFEMFKHHYEKSRLKMSPYYLHSIISNIYFNDRNNINSSSPGSLTYPKFMELYRDSIRAKTTTLTYIPKSEIEDAEIAGLDIFKDIAMKAARKMDNDPSTKAVKFLLVGPPGTGKTAAAKWLAKYTGRDLYQIDISKAMSPTLGSSETAIRNDLELVRNLGPIVLHIDEIEKTIGGSQSSNRTDGGTVMRIMEYVMRFLSDPPPNIFILATANILRDIPPELIRTGRMSYVFYVDYPTYDELAEMIRIHAKKYSVKLTERESFCLANILSSRSQYCGSDVATIWEQADMMKDDPNSPPTLDDFMKAFLKVQPTYEKMKEKIEENRILSMQYEPASSKGLAYETYKSNLMRTINQFTSFSKDPVDIALQNAIKSIENENETNSTQGISIGNLKL
jgi:hypothetical protein